jgi:hypothetical protein
VAPLADQMLRRVAARPRQVGVGDLSDGHAVCRSPKHSNRQMPRKRLQRVAGEPLGCEAIQTKDSPAATVGRIRASPRPRRTNPVASRPSIARSGGGSAKLRAAVLAPSRGGVQVVG